MTITCAHHALILYCSREKRSGTLYCGRSCAKATHGYWSHTHTHTHSFLAVIFQLNLLVNRLHVDSPARIPTGVGFPTDQMPFVSPTQSERNSKH